MRLAVGSECVRASIHDSVAVRDELRLVQCLGEGICDLVLGWDPLQFDSAQFHVFANEVESRVDVFGSVVDVRCGGDRLCGLVVDEHCADDGRVREFAEEQSHP